MRTLTGVSGHFSASHHDPDSGDLHGHTWDVLAWFEHRAPMDARCDKAALDHLLKSFDHTILLEHMSRGEDIARLVGALVNCVEVQVSRDREGYHARWEA